MNNQHSLFFNATDLNFKPFSVNKKYVVSIKSINQLQTEIKTSVGDVFITKDLSTNDIIKLFETLSHVNVEVKHS